MKNKRNVVLAVALGLLAVPLALPAHHGTAIYDTGRTITVHATVTEWLWSNPHCLLEFDVKDDKGETVHWNAEVSTPPDMIARGWSKKMFKPGDEVTLTIVPAKNGEPIGRITQVVLNGKTYAGMGAPPAPAGGAGKQ